MPPSRRSLREDALRIWQAGLEAVRADRLVREHIHVQGNSLTIGDESLDLASIRRILVVGAGKAGAGMAAGLEQALGPDVLAAKDVSGWINVPADCVRPLGRIHMHAARPAGRNEPTAEGQRGAEEILRLASSLDAMDLCVCLLSGGASALLPAPVAEISLADKLAVTQYLSAAGANILELNTVRKHLSRIKGGGLARACTAGRLVTLILSDVPGDPLDVIGSGPTVEDSSTSADGLAVLARYGGRHAEVPPSVWDYLANRRESERRAPRCNVTNLIVGNNALAVDAAGREAVRLGFSPVTHSSAALEGPAEDIGRELAERALAMRDGHGPDCLITGGEPTVTLVDAAHRGLGGRNQQLVLAAALRLLNDSCRRIALLSGGTDGEDGPTDAAGAVLDAELLAEARHRGLDPADYLARNDAYHFFQPLAGLIKTGPTHTNVCDMRIVVVK